MVALVPTEAHGDERGALLNFVEAQRAALRRAVLGLSEEQAASRPSASELSLSGLIKHVAEVELNWLRMAQQQPNERVRTEATWGEGFRLVNGETIPEIVAFWDGVAKETEEYVRSVPSLDDTFPLPKAPGSPRTGGSPSAGCSSTSYRRPASTRRARRRHPRVPGRQGLLRADRGGAGGVTPRAYPGQN